MVLLYFRTVRDRRASYIQSLNTLEAAKSISYQLGQYKSSSDNNSVSSLVTKSSIMLGLGETDQELMTTLKDLRSEIGRAHV